MVEESYRDEENDFLGGGKDLWPSLKKVGVFCSLLFTRQACSGLNAKARHFYFVGLIDSF
jgi:hypothetical protein